MKKLIILIAIAFISCSQEDESFCECNHSFQYFDDYQGWKSEPVTQIVNDCNDVTTGRMALIDNQNNVIGETFISCESK